MFIETQTSFGYTESVPTELMASREETARQIVDICHRLYERRLVTATDGNVSARLAGGTILVTPSDLAKGQVAESDLVEVQLDGSPASGQRRPTSELGMHLFIYRQRPDVGAVVHAHPPYATAFAAARRPLECDVFPEVAAGLGRVPLARYGTPSTGEVARSIAPYVKSARAILLANHGVVTYSRTLEEAFNAMEKVEHAAHMLLITRMLGGAKALTSRELRKLSSAMKEENGTASAAEKKGRRRQKH